MTIIAAAVAMLPPGTGNQMSFVGAFTYSQFAGASLQVGDFAIYLSNYPGLAPTGGSGNAWQQFAGYNGFLKYKLVETGDIGVVPTNPDSSKETSPRFIVYRGPGSATLEIASSDPRGQSYTKAVKHCGTFMFVEQQPGTSFIPDTPAAWLNRRSQSVTWGGTSLTNLRFYDRIEPANDTYVDGDPLDGAVSGSGSFYTRTFEFLIP